MALPLYQTRPSFDENTIVYTYIETVCPSDEKVEASIYAWWPQLSSKQTLGYQLIRREFDKGQKRPVREEQIFRALMDQIDAQMRQKEAKALKEAEAGAQQPARNPTMVYPPRPASNSHPAVDSRTKRALQLASTCMIMGVVFCVVCTESTLSSLLHHKCHSKQPHIHSLWLSNACLKGFACLRLHEPAQAYSYFSGKAGEIFEAAMTPKKYTAAAGERLQGRQRIHEVGQLQAVVANARPRIEDNEYAKALRTSSSSNKGMDLSRQSRQSRYRERQKMLQEVLQEIGDAQGLKNVSLTIQRDPSIKNFTIAAHGKAKME